MPRVFVIGPGEHDYSPAEQYGQLVTVGRNNVNPFKTDELVAMVHKAFVDHQFSCDDALLLGGSAMLNAVAVSFAQSWFSKVRVLVYGARHHDYVLRDFSVVTPKGGCDGQRASA